MFVNCMHYMKDMSLHEIYLWQVFVNLMHYMKDMGLNA